jgi:hypothetical protein
MPPLYGHFKGLDSVLIFCIMWACCLHTGVGRPPPLRLFGIIFHTHLHMEAVMRSATVPVALALCLLVTPAFLLAQGTFVRSAMIPVPAIENNGFGNMISGVDFDGDGKPEIYVVNGMQDLGGAELIPRIYKFEFNGTTWDSVWSATLNIPLQNSWPALTYGDWDNDGKMEIIWGPVNYTDATTNPNPARIVVFEAKGDGSDIMGVPDGMGNFTPNTSWTIVTQDNFNLRPFRWFLTDIDNDGEKELVFASRVSGHRFGVVHVTGIPDDGPAFEGWTLEVSGLSPNMTIDASTIYDLAIIDSTIYLIHENGNITPIQYANGTWSSRPIQFNAVPGGSWKSASVVDLDNDGTKEIVVGAWQTFGPAANQNIFLLQRSGDTLSTTVIANLTSLIGAGGRFNGGAFGDIDNDGMLDFAFGGRATTPNAAVIRLRYLGGDITNPANYEPSIIDSNLAAEERNWDIINIANVDADPDMEVLYSNDRMVRPIVVLDRVATGVRQEDGVLPAGFELEQNYPNPFNPGTNIGFRIPDDGFVSLKVYDVLGREVATLVDQYMAPGAYVATFDGTGLSSGVYFYVLAGPGGIRLSRQMLLLK